MKTEKYPHVEFKNMYEQNIQCCFWEILCAWAVAELGNQLKSIQKVHKES